MSRFKIGQKVVALRTHSLRLFRKGDVLTIDGFTCCPKCGIHLVYLYERNFIVNNNCPTTTGCGYKDIGVRAAWYESNFAPLQSSSEAIEYKLKVSIPELLEITKLQEA